jgi:hypothetical protein
MTDDESREASNNKNGTLIDESLVGSNPAAPSLVLILVPTLIGVSILVLVGTIILVKIRKPSTRV